VSGVQLLFVGLAVAAVIGAIGIPIVTAALRHRTGFQFSPTSASRVISSDVGNGVSLVLRDDRLGICGKPDYLMQMTTAGESRFVPLEVKPSRQSQRLYDSDRVQIAVYLIALRATVADRASAVGYVRYRNRTFEVPLTAELEAEVERLTAALRRGRAASVMHRSHNIAARCRGCPVRQHCDESLAD